MNVALFAHNEKLGGGFVLVRDEFSQATTLPTLPSRQIDDTGPSLDIIARDLTSKYLALDPKWPLYFKRDFIHEWIAENGKVLQIVYLGYFPDLIEPLHGAKWIKINNLDEVDEVSKEIILLTAQRRY